MAEEPARDKAEGVCGVGVLGAVGTAAAVAHDQLGPDRRSVGHHARARLRTKREHRHPRHADRRCAAATEPSARPAQPRLPTAQAALVDVDDRRRQWGSIVGQPVVLVTGGSRGIGAATALLAARAGYAVAVGYRLDRAAAEEIVAELDGPGVAIGADVASEAEVVRMFAEIDEKLGRLDALVNNAGVLEGGRRVDRIDEKRLRRVLDANVVGPFLCAREAVRRMSTAHGGNGGAIVNVSSAASRLGAAGEYVDYAASKGALDTLTTGL
ncbi:MAG: SDR family NAD(P)-dependent oxidoreductase, partial [Pseudonocardiales bacterium]|nr:SDR family NAD(P)-dependent oxidoreductase [Pseudonocardiales bacterium]